MASRPTGRAIEALSRLSEADRSLLQLSVGHGLSDEEVGGLIGVAAGEVESRRTELLERLVAEGGLRGPAPATRAFEELVALPAEAWTAAGRKEELRPVEEEPAKAEEEPARAPEEERRRVVFQRAVLIAPRAGFAALLLLPGTLVVFLSVNGGGFFAGTTALVALVAIVAMILRVTLAERPFEGYGPVVAIASGAMALFAIWTLISGAWSDAESRALLEFDRALLYLLVLVLAGSMLRTPGRVRWMVRGVAAGVVVVCAIGLITRVLPEVWPIERNVSDERLSYPITYWNALGLVAALGIVLSAFITTDEREPWPMRVLGAAALPVLGATLLLTFSRGAILATVIALVVFAVVGRPRGLLPGIVAAVPATAIAVVLTYRADLLGTERYSSAMGIAQGKDAALAIGLCVAGALLLRLLLLPADRAIAEFHLPTRVRRPVTAGAAGAAVVGCVVLALALDAPSYVQRQYDRFVEGATPNTGTSRERLNNPANNGRLSLWRVARAAWGRERLHGAGAGTYQTLWDRHRREAESATDGHSLYLEVLAELGVVGLALLAVAMAMILARLAFLARGPDRAAYAAILAMALCWCLHAAVDWDWEMPAVTLPFFALGGLALASGAPRLGSPGRLTRVSIGIGLLVLAVTPGLILTSQSRLNESVRAFRHNDCDRAIDRALGSAAALSVRPEPYEILGLCDARRRGAGELGVQMMEEAVSRDPDNWEFRYGLALVRGAARLDPRAAAREAQRLNPRSELTRDAVRRFNTNDPQKWERRARTARLSF